MFLFQDKGKIKNEFKGLQAFAFCMVTVIDEPWLGLGSKESVGVKYKDGICTGLCLRLWFHSDWYFCNITESDGFETKLQTITL